MEIRAYLDYECHPCSRATGVFQVIELKDEQGNDVTNMVTIGTVYNSLDMLQRELDMAYGMPLPPITVVEED